MAGHWHIVYTSLPLWKDKRNVTEDYAAIEPDASGIVRIDDTASYQKLNSDKIHTIHGIDTPTPGADGAFDWRGKGWLKIASSHWEILGWGDLGDGAQWIVTYFSKTLFTPAGIDIYSRTKEGLSEKALDDILSRLKELEAAELKVLVEGIFQVKQE